MNSYKLKNPYPGIPEDWEKGMIIANNIHHPHIYFPVDKKYDMHKIYSQEIKWKHYWEHVNIFGDVQILSYIDNDQKQHKNCASGYKIYSIKIISSGLIISLNDKVYYAIGDEYPMSVKNIHIEHNKCYFISTENICFPIESIKASKKYYFHTLEGVPIYEGDSWYYVVMAAKNPVPKKTSIPKCLHNPEVVRFASEFNANQYIKENLKTWTLNEIIHVCVKNGFNNQQAKKVYDALIRNVKKDI